MTDTNKLTDEALECVSDGSVIVSNSRVSQMARELLAYRRASQAQPTGTELLPCPFCGDNHATTTYTRDGRLVVCTSCGAKSGNYYHGPKDLPSADERAIAAWNRRASQAAPTGGEA